MSFDDFEVNLNSIIIRLTYNKRILTTFLGEAVSDLLSKQFSMFFYAQKRKYKKKTGNFASKYTALIL